MRGGGVASARCAPIARALPRVDRARASTTARALARVAPPWRAPVALESLGARRARGLVGTAAARAGRVVASASDDAEEDDVDRVVDANDFESEDADEGAVRAADEAVVGARVDADVDELLSSVRTTTTWGGDWAEFVIFLARLQALGYSGVNADEIVVAAGDSKTPEWARGVSGGGDDAAAGADSESEFESDEEDLTPSDPGEIKRLALSFARDRPDLFSRLPESLVYQLIDWPLPRRLNNRKLNAGLQRLRASMSMDVSHLRGKCSACDKLQDRQENPALQLSDLLRVLLVLNDIDDPDEFADLPSKELASDCVRRLLRLAESPKPPPEEMPIDTSKVSTAKSSTGRRSFDDRPPRYDDRGRGRGRGDSFRGQRRDDWGRGGGSYERRDDRAPRFERRDDRGGYERRRDDGPPRFERRDRDDRREEFGSRFDDRRSDDRFGDRGGRGRGGYEGRGGRGGRGRGFDDDRRQSFDRFDDRPPRFERRDGGGRGGDFGGRFDDRGGRGGGRFEDRGERFGGRDGGRFGGRGGDRFGDRDGSRGGGRFGDRGGGRFGDRDGGRGGGRFGDRGGGRFGDRDGGRGGGRFGDRGGRGGRDSFRNRDNFDDRPPRRSFDDRRSEDRGEFGRRFDDRRPERDSFRPRERFDDDSRPRYDNEGYRARPQRRSFNDDDRRSPPRDDRRRSFDDGRRPPPRDFGERRPADDVQVWRQDAGDDVDRGGW